MRTLLSQNHPSTACRRGTAEQASRAKPAVTSDL